MLFTSIRNNSRDVHLTQLDHRALHRQCCVSSLPVSFLPSRCSLPLLVIRARVCSSLLHATTLASTPPDHASTFVPISSVHAFLSTSVLNTRSDSNLQLDSLTNRMAQRSPLGNPPVSPLLGQGPVDAATPSLMAQVNTTMEPSEKDHDQHLDHQIEDTETEGLKAEHKASPFVYPSGIPGMDNCIFGPRIPGSSAKAPTTPHYTTIASRKRKADELESEDIDTANNTSPSLSPSKQRSTSNDAEEYQQPSSLSDLVHEVRDSLHPYTDFHPSCDATEPIKKIHASLSSSTLTPIAVSRLLYEAYTILKALHECQAGTYFKLEPLRGVLQKSDMHSLLEDAYEKVRQTEEDIEQFEKWMEECDAMVTWRAL